MPWSARARKPAFFAVLTTSIFAATSLEGCVRAAPAQLPQAPPASAHHTAPSAPPAASTSPAARRETSASRVLVAPHPVEIALDPKQPMRALPELKVENIGLHVGGGPNDPATKAPFLRAIAERFPQFMDCYRKADEPAKGGRFGVDLHVARSGGHPRLEQPRTVMRGQDFRACVSAVFESVQFAKPTRGPTTISYSLRFGVDDLP